MHISKRTKYQLLEIMVEAVQRLAQEIALKENQVFSEFKKSLSTSKHGITLAQILIKIDQDSPKKRELTAFFDKNFGEKLHVLSKIITCVFNVDIQVEELSLIIDPLEEMDFIGAAQELQVPFDILSEKVARETRELINRQFFIAELEQHQEETAKPLEEEHPLPEIPPIHLSHTFFNSHSLLNFFNCSAESHNSVILSASGIQLKSALRRRTGSSAKKVKFNDNVDIKEEASLGDFCEDIFITNRLKARQLIVALIRLNDVKQLDWVTQILNKASDAHHLSIVDVLMDELKDDELLALYKNLFKLESNLRWGHDTKLLYLFLHHFMLSEHNAKFKELVWSKFSTLIPFLLNFDPENDPMEVVKTIRYYYYKALQTAFNPAIYSELMQKVLKLAWADLHSRTAPDFIVNTQLELLIGFIAMRFINPILLEKCAVISEENKKRWCGTVIPAALKAIATPTSKSDPFDVQGVLFAAVTQNKYLRGCLFGGVCEWLRINFKSQRAKEPSIRKLSLEQCHKQLGDLLQQDVFSGLRFKKNGLVKPPSGHQSIVHFFKAQPAADTSQEEPWLLPIDETFK